MSFEFDQAGIYAVIIAGLFAASFLVQMGFSLYFYLRLAYRRANDAITNSGEPVSVIICARNDAVNLEKNLPVMLEQDYGNYEVVVVDDCSEDNTEELLEGFKSKYKNLRSTRINKDKKFRHGKKLALTIGLKSANYEWVLLTDADCRPSSPRWISFMQNHFSTHRQVVLGYGGYLRQKGILNKLIRFDTFFIALQYLSFASAGYPYMGVGRNLAYRRSLFFANKGFASHLKLESGDDDLFINEVSKRENTGIEFSHPAHTCSVPPKSWSEWYRQKRRHLTTGIHYKLSTRILLGLEISSRLVFYISFILLLSSGVLLFFALILFLIRLITNYVIFRIVMNRLNEKKLLFFSFIFEPVILLFNIFCVASNVVIQKRSRWR